MLVLSALTLLIGWLEGPVAQSRVSKALKKNPKITHSKNYSYNSYRLPNHPKWLEIPSLQQCMHWCTTCDNSQLHPTFTTASPSDVKTAENSDNLVHSQLVSRYRRKNHRHRWRRRRLWCCWQLWFHRNWYHGFSWWLFRLRRWQRWRLRFYRLCFRRWRCHWVRNLNLPGTSRIPWHTDHGCCRSRIVRHRSFVGRRDTHCGGGLLIVIVEWIGDFPGTDLAVDIKEVSAMLRCCVDDDWWQIVKRRLTVWRCRLLNNK